MDKEPTNRSAENTPRTVRAVQITCNLINELNDQEAAGVTDLAESTGYAKSTIHRHLTTLRENGLVVKDNSEYRLSLRYFEIAENIKNNIGNYGVIEEEIDKLSEECGETAQFAIEEQGEVAYFYKSKSPSGIDTASTIGQRMPMHSTGLGKAILAFLPEERAIEILEHHGCPERTENTITNQTDLMNHLEEVRENGYAIDDQENVRGIRCVAAPVLDDDNVFGAVSVSGPASRFIGSYLREELPNLVQSAANIIEVNSRFGENRY